MAAARAYPINMKAKIVFCWGIAAIVLSAFLGANSAEAKIFSNQFIEFQLPEKWKCQLDGSEWVCQSTDEQKKRDAIIVLAAKIKKVGMDELPVYKTHLEKKQVYQAPNGQRVVSEPRYVKEVSINSKKWIDSLHLQSEIPDFFTRYLATVEADIGILVTFSVRKDKFTEYAADIDALVKSLRAFRKPGALNKTAADLAPEGIDDTIIEPTLDLGKCPPGQKLSKKTGLCVKPQKRTKDGGDDMFFILVLLAVGIAGFIIWKKKKGQG